MSTSVRCKSVLMIGLLFLMFSIVLMCVFHRFDLFYADADVLALVDKCSLFDVADFCFDDGLGAMQV